MRIHFISIPENISLPAEQFFIRKGYETLVTETVAEAQNAIESEAFDIFLLDPFANFSTGAYILTLLRDYSLISKTILVGHDEKKLSEISNKLNCGGFLLTNTNYSSWVDTIANLHITDNSLSEHPYIIKPKKQVLKGEIEKAKRGHTSVSFLYFKINPNIFQNKENAETLFQKILITANYRLRISDDAMIFENGILISLFGTKKKDREFITDLIKKRVRRSLKHLNYNFEESITIGEATYPDDGNTFEEIISLLGSSKKEFEKTQRKKSNLILTNVQDLLEHRITINELFRVPQKDSTNVINKKLSDRINTLPKPPDWFQDLSRTLFSQDTSPRQFEQIFLKNCPIPEKVLQIGRGLLLNTKNQYELPNLLETAGCKEILLVLGSDEFKNVLTYATINHIIYNNAALETNPIREFSLMTSAISLEISKQIEYYHKSEIILISAAYNLNLFLLKDCFDDLFALFFNSKSTPFSVLAKNCYETTGATLSSMALPYLKLWGLEDPLLESIKCGKYEFSPQMNPQLVALNYMATCIVNHFSGLQLNGNLKLCQIAWDEILLRNRNIKVSDFDYLSQFDEIMQNYSFLYI